MPPKNHRTISLLCLLILLPLLSACGPRDAVEVSLTSFNIALSTDTVKTGKVRFSLKNDSPDVHEFVIIQTVLPADQLPALINHRVSEDVLNVVSRAEDIQPGATRELAVNLSTGQYVVLCNLPGHYEKGMHAQLTVAP